MKTFALSLVAATALTVPAFAAEWDMPTPYGDSTFHTANIIQMAEEIRAATDGAFDITVHSAGSLFAHPEIKNSVRRGLAPIGELLVSRLANEDPIFGLDAIPFVATSYEEAKALYDAQKPALEEALAEQGLTFLYAVPWPPQGIYAKTAVEDISALEGVKFRAYNAATERLAQLVGAIPTQVEVPDIPTAFSTGRVDAMITSPSTGANQKVWDFLTHYVDTQAWLPKNMVVVNTEALEALTDAEREALMTAAAAAETRGWEMSAAETEEKTQALRDNGIDVSAPTEALMSAMAEVGTTMAAEWEAEAGETGAAVLEAYRQ
ncbi:MAG: TRAP transporter substrate-binding protein [Pseudomonadota bacterium]